MAGWVQSVYETGIVLGGLVIASDDIDRTQDQGGTVIELPIAIKPFSAFGTAATLAFQHFYFDICGDRPPARSCTFHSKTAHMQNMTAKLTIITE